MMQFFYLFPPLFLCGVSERLVGDVKHLDSGLFAVGVGGRSVWTAVGQATHGTVTTRGTVTTEQTATSRSESKKPLLTRNVKSTKKEFENDTFPLNLMHF